MKNMLTLGACAAVLLVSGQVWAAPSLKDVTESISQGDLTQVKPYMASNPSNVDQIVHALLTYAQGSVAKEPGSASAAVDLAKSYANNITPPGVPMICSDVREVVQALPPDAKDKSPALYNAVFTTSQAFSKAPVVVSAGRPNLCENAFLEGFEDAELAQAPGFAAPTIRTRLPEVPHVPGVIVTPSTPVTPASPQ